MVGNAMRIRLTKIWHLIPLTFQLFRLLRQLPVSVKSDRDKVLTPFWDTLTKTIQRVGAILGNVSVTKTIDRYLIFVYKKGILVLGNIVLFLPSNLITYPDIVITANHECNVHIQILTLDRLQMSHAVPLWLLQVWVILQLLYTHSSPTVAASSGYHQSQGTLTSNSHDGTRAYATSRKSKCVYICDKSWHWSILSCITHGCRWCGVLLMLFVFGGW